MPKINIEQITRQLSQGIPPIVLISGDETLLVEEACDTVRQSAKKHGFTEREVHSTNDGFVWSELVHSSNSLSLFGDKKIIEVRLHNGKPGDKGSKAIVEYCSHTNEDTLLLIVSPKIDKAATNSKWYKSIDACGPTLQIWPVSVEQLPQWLDKRLKKAGLQADSAAIDILTTKVEGNLLAGAQEIEKLKILVNDGFITADIMREAVSESARFNVFNVIDKALAQDAAGAAHALNGLRGEGSAPAMILGAITNEIRKLTSIKEMLEAGTPFQQAAKSLRVWGSKERLVKHATSSLSLNQFHTLLKKLVLADKTLKGMSTGDLWAVLLDIVLSLSSVQSFDTKTQRQILR